MAAAETGSAMPADRIYLVDEDDARRVLLGLLEHVTDAGGAHSDEHLDEIGAGNGKERHLGLPRDRAREKGLAGAGGPYHQHTTGNLAAELLELGRFAQEVHQLRDLFLRLVHSRHVGKCDLHLVLAQQTSPALAEGQCATTAPTALHLAHEEYPYSDQQQHREPGDEYLHENRLLFGRTGVDHYAVLEQVRDEGGVVHLGNIGLEALAALVDAIDVAAFQDHLLHSTVLGIFEETGRIPLAGATPGAVRSC